MNLNSMELQRTKLTYFVCFINAVTMCRNQKIWKSQTIIST